MYFFIVRELRRNITLIIDPIDDVPNCLWPQFLHNSLYEINTIDLPGSTGVIACDVNRSIHKLNLCTLQGGASCLLLSSV